MEITPQIAFAYKITATIIISIYDRSCDRWESLPVDSMITQEANYTATDTDD